MILEGRLRAALARLNPPLPAEALDDTFHRLLHPESPALEFRNRGVHRVLVKRVLRQCGYPPDEQEKATKRYSHAMVLHTPT